MYDQAKINAIVQEINALDNDAIKKQLKALDRKKALTEDQEIRQQLLQDILNDRCRKAQMEAIPLPTCCEAARKYPAILFTVFSYDDEDSNKSEGRWLVATHDRMSDYARAKFCGDKQTEWFKDRPAPKFCPYCGTGLPEMRRKAVPPEGMCRIEDGGYYCSTCKERLNACLCLPCEAAFEPVP